MKTCVHCKEPLEQVSFDPEDLDCVNPKCVIHRVARDGDKEPYLTCGSSYTYEKMVELCKREYDERPYLRIIFDDPVLGRNYSPIQTAHITASQAKEIFGGTRWILHYVTRENIPLFNYDYYWNDGFNLDDALSKEYFDNDFGDGTPWIVPRKYPREFGG